MDKDMKINKDLLKTTKQYNEDKLVKIEGAEQSGEVISGRCKKTMQNSY